MSESDAREAYEALVNFLRENHLDWLAEQINDEVVLGKVKSERIAVTGDGEIFNDLVVRTILPARPKRPSSEFLARAEYSAHEKFDIAVGAIRAVVVGAVRIQDALADTLKEHDNEIAFVPGETGDTHHAFRASDLSSQRVAVSNLEQLLNQLVEDVKK